MFRPLQGFFHLLKNHFAFAKYLLIWQKYCKKMCAMIVLLAVFYCDITKVKMQKALETQSELNALLLALTGSAGTTELDENQVCSLLCVGQRLCSEVLQFLRTASSK